MNVVSAPPGGRSRTRRQTGITIALTAIVMVAIALSLSIGARSIPLSTVVDALLGSDSTADAVVITSQRLPRTLLGLLAGVAFGMAGALMQGHTRNPLAEPGLFGVNAGAGFAVAIMAFAFGVSTPIGIIGAALIGAAIASFLVFFLGLGHLRGGALVMLAVIGTTVSALLSSLTSGIVLLDRQSLDVMRFWEVGSLAGRDTSYAPLLTALIVTGAVVAVANGFSINSLGLGEDVARSLGVNVIAARVLGIVGITLLAGAATAACGPVVFVGLVAPHAARLLSGHDYRWLVPQAGLIGAALLLVADTIGRVIASPGELQVGIVMSIVGAPVLIAITRRRRMVAL